MNGAEALIETALTAGVEFCFANPGTTELPIVKALDDVPGIRAVLCLQEGVCAGAADGYGRMTNRPALTLFHLGPGFANAIAYLHDARRARSPIVNLIGDQASWHLPADPPLASDIISLARPVSDWVRSNRSPDELAADMAEAIAVSSFGSGRVATLIIPHDHQLGTATSTSQPAPVPSPPKVSSAVVRQAAELLRTESAAALLLGGLALREPALRAAGRIVAKTGCRIICGTFPARLERGGDLPPVERIPYFPDQAVAMLSRTRGFVLIGERIPVAFFGYPGLPSYLISGDQHTVIVATQDEDVTAALEALADEVGTPSKPHAVRPAPKPERPEGPLTLETLAAALAFAQPEGAIIMDEGNTSSAAYRAMNVSWPRHSCLTQTGGAIGLGLPCATGAALACPDRPVIVLQADGSAMYTLQALWTQSREGLNVTTLLCNNGGYRVLGIEMARAGLREPGPQTRAMLSISQPSLNWIGIAESLGVPARRAEDAGALVRYLEQAIREPGPHLIEVPLTGAGS